MGRADRCGDRAEDEGDGEFENEVAVLGFFEVEQHVFDPAREHRQDGQDCSTLHDGEESTPCTKASTAFES